MDEKEDVRIIEDIKSSIFLTVDTWTFEYTENEMTGISEAPKTAFIHKIQFSSSRKTPIIKFK